MTDHAADKTSQLTATRRAVMALLAQAKPEEIREGLGEIAANAICTDVRAAETGLVMVRGRIGGDGAPFNLGEATVTRAAVRLPSGEIGFSYVLGRDREKARHIAICDALFQCGDHRDALERHVLAPIRKRVEAERGLVAEQTAATRVDFFTLVRGEN